MELEKIDRSIVEGTREVWEDKRLRPTVQKAIEYQREKISEGYYEKFDHAGFGCSDVDCPGWHPGQLVNAGIAVKTYSSNSSSYWRIAVDPPDRNGIRHVHDEVETVIDAIENDTLTESTNSNTAPRYESLDSVDPAELFSGVVHRDEAKQMARRSIEKYGEIQVHHLFYGPPGGGKSEMLDEVQALPGGERVVLSGNQASAAGIRDVLIEKRPRFLVVEEIEKGSKSDREALMTLCGEGYVSRTKSGNPDQEIPLDTVVFAASNDLDAITPASLIDRFLTWEFDRYTLDEFKDVCVAVLPDQADVSTTMAETVADAVYQHMDSTQIRDALKVAELAEDPDEVNWIARATG